jgi:Rps23 Pro-64 3,4-dihydroxylase Tpa1-like proline 4-hydroxylase
MYVNQNALNAASAHFKGQSPFDHCVIDGFFLPEIAAKLEQEFPDFDSKTWHEYSNAIEIKKTCNNWNVFPPLTYQVVTYLNSSAFSDKLAALLGFPELTGDPGLNGGGWHIHKRGGKLNTHLDYNIHPKLGRQRKLNIIVYLNSSWQPEWGGQLGLWAQSAEGRKPGKLEKSVDPVFNRAVLFDTTQNSWHGLPTPLSCPEGQARKSLAIYYLAPAPADADTRGKALFAPTPEQEGDQDILDLIKRRAEVASASEVYRGK